MEGKNENHSVTKVWFTVFGSLTFCYFNVRKIPQRLIRFFSILPIIFLFTILPLYHTAMHAILITSFFLTWLGSFKLLLFVFNQGPLSSDPSISLLHFISIACLPINSKNKKHHTSQQIAKKSLESTWKYVLKFLLLLLAIRIYDYKEFIHPNIVSALHSCNMYLAAEIVLAIFAAPAQALFGIETEPQFNDPYLSTSLQNFWGKRWNLIVTNVLRPTVFIPVRNSFIRILGKRRATLVGVMATFIVSGLMHELIYFYGTHVRPTWEVTWCFILHGLCTAIEIVVKEACGDRLRLNPVISRVITIAFLLLTNRLFFTQALRHGVVSKMVKEYSVLFNFMKGAVAMAIENFR
ncbi:hypothetical protein AQUCO_04500138v1 [Aquilegia coerulea]|uniref:Wax synthase domain-containing protein n=1 Tax=Aquilegia coerulea TaxID=218851 RepID=A0A2G5CM65_AQUCA|nr:hypothetical protein AQUCO_04500138v1 [Aquilegia coerulea]